VTFAAAVLVPQQSQVEMISAGHGPILHYVAAERKLIEFHANDLPLGVAPAVQYAPAAQLNMQPGDLLLFITDGFFEWARPDGEAFGLERLREAVIDAANLPLDQVITSIFRKVKHFTEGTVQADDVTAVVMRRQ
jgi:phosphoserine phosphatase